MNLPDLILLEQTGKDKGLSLFTCHMSIKTVNAWTGWMKNQNIIAMNTFKNSSGFKDFTQQDSEKTRRKWEQNDVEVHPSKALFFFYCSHKRKNNGGKLFPRSPFRNSCKLACYEVVWSRHLVLLNERRSYIDAWIAVVNGCIACICSLKLLVLFSFNSK